MKISASVLVPDGRRLMGEGMHVDSTVSRKHALTSFTAHHPPCFPPMPIATDPITIRVHPEAECTLYATSERERQSTFHSRMHPWAIRHMVPLHRIYSLPHCMLSHAKRMKCIVRAHLLCTQDSNPNPHQCWRNAR